MAKKTRTSEPAGTIAVAEEQLKNFAEDLSTLLGHAQNKADSWLGQRKAIADQLVGVRDTASRLLAQLGISDALPAARRGRKPGSKNRVKAEATGAGAKRGVDRPAKKKRSMSAEAREKIAAAQRNRWAKQKSAEGR